MTIHYPTAAASLPAAEFNWIDVNGATLDFSSGWTFKLTIGRPPNAAVLTKTTGLVGRSTSPNLFVNWAPNELAVLTPGIWNIQVTASSSDGHQRILSGTLRIDAAVIS